MARIGAFILLVAVIAILPVAIVPRHPVYVTLAAALIAVVVIGLVRRR